MSETKERFTAALLIYWLNLGRIVSLSNAVERDTGRTLEEVGAELDELSRKIEAGEQIADLNKTLDGLKHRQSNSLTPSEVAQSWYVVMHVSCVENYLEDALVHCASLDPGFLKNSTQEIPAQDVLGAGNLDDLKSRIRRKWAKNWRDDCGPKTWIERFERMGVRGFPAGIGDTLAEMWTVRNLVVHDGGIITGRFVANAPRFAAQGVGRFLKVDGNDIVRYVGAMTGFVRAIDAWTFQRYPDQPPVKITPRP